MHFNRVFIFIALLVLAATCAAPAWAEGHGRRGYSWLESLTAEQRQTAERIVSEVRPRIQELRQGVRQKMMELQSFSYRNDEDSEELSRLGHELQNLRDTLREELQTLDERLVREVGIAPQPHRGRSCSSLNSRMPQGDGEVRGH